MVKDVKFNPDKAKRERGVRIKWRAVPKSKEHQQKFLEMLFATGELPDGISTFKGYADSFRPKPWFENLLGFSDDQEQAVEEETRMFILAPAKSWKGDGHIRALGTTHVS